MSERPVGGRPEHDIYTVLLALATFITLGAVIFLAMRSQLFFERWLPF